jgi:hypothetical protein
VELLRISWDEGWGIEARAVKRGLARGGAEVGGRIGVDEKAIAKRHRYLTIVADLEHSRVLYLADDRQPESLDGFWPTLTAAQRDGITAVAMDMGEPYVPSTRTHLPGTDDKIVLASSTSSSIGLTLSITSAAGSTAPSRGPSTNGSPGPSTCGCADRKT